jgi:hypothetical protein
MGGICAFFPRFPRIVFLLLSIYSASLPVSQRLRASRGQEPWQAQGRREEAYDLLAPIHAQPAMARITPANPRIFSSLSLSGCPCSNCGSIVPPAASVPHLSLGALVCAHSTFIEVFLSSHSSKCSCHPPWRMVGIVIASSNRDNLTRLNQ